MFGIEIFIPFDVGFNIVAYRFDHSQKHMVSSCGPFHLIHEQRSLLEALEDLSGVQRKTSPASFFLAEVFDVAGQPA